MTPKLGGSQIYGNGVWKGEKYDPEVMIRTANLRYARLAISNLRPKEKDAFFIELNEALDQDELCYKGQRIGAAKVLPKAPSSKKNLVDQASQVWPGDFFNFDKEVVPILERLIGAVCYQARLEVLEEAELEALKIAAKLFEEKEREEEEESNKLKSRVNKQIAEQKRQMDLVRDHAQDAKNGKLAYGLFGGVYVEYSVEGAMKAMNDDWEKAVRIRAAIENEFNGWVNGEVERQLTLHKDAQRMLDDIIRNVVSEREAVYSVEPYVEDPIRIFSDNLESSRVPPPTPGSSVYYTSDEEEFAAGLPDESSPNYFVTDDVNN